MKKLLSLFVVMLLAEGLQANPLDLQSAQQKAERLLGKETTLVTANNARQQTTADDNAYYFFNAKDNCGFAIIAVDDALGEVLGYSHQGHLTDTQALPDALKLFLEAYQQYAQLYRQGLVRATVTKAPARVAGAEPLLKTQWDQGSPYNSLCPISNGKNSLTGCVATAIAQIMKYWNWPVKGSGYGNGTCDGNVVHGTLEHEYNWDAMLNTTAELNQSGTAASAVAELMYDCGLAVNMDYSSSSSSAGTPIKALYSNFGYIPTQLRLHHRSCFDTDAEWLDMLFSEIDQNRPVYYTASSSTNGGKDTAGHAFVIDGYDANSNLHVNWGWGGDVNGYYSVQLMNPKSYQFIINQDAIIGIEPAKNGETGVPIEYPYMGDAPVCSQKGTISKLTDFGITVSNIWNHTGSAHEWTVSIGLYDIQNTLLGDAKKRGGGIGAVKLEPNYGYNGVLGEITCNLSSKTLANGHYALRVMFKETGSWILPDMAGGLKNNAVYIEVNGNNITFTDGTAYREASIAAGINGINMPSTASAPVFDLQGRRVQTPGKGIYIIGGKKVVK